VQKAEFKQEQDLVLRLQAELDAERKMLNDKREQEKSYLQKMLEENDRERAKKDAQLEKERLEDVAAQEEHARMLDKQQADRENEFKARENRAQLFMNRMASTVIEAQNTRQAQEDANIHKYELEREMRMRLEDEKKIEIAKMRKLEMREYLYRQMNEKRDRESNDKALNDEQAVMWRKDKDLFEVEEKRLHDKIKGINADNASFLNRQVCDKKMRTANGGMNKNENQYNKGLLKMINQKRKDPSNYDGMSRQ